MINLCTLFASNYSAKGLAMYWSLERVCPSFHLYIFAFDDLCAEIFKKINLPHATIITLQEFEDPELLRVKPTRTMGEYCWTCSSSVIKYCIEHYNLDCCTGIDADLYFFSDPTCLIEELGEKDVLLTEHRYTPKYDQTKGAGKYCVQFSTFKNTKKGMDVLNWWRNACLDWCYRMQVNGKFGDQKYLDDWMTRFDCAHELQHLGGGVAPWNMQQYEFRKINGKVYGYEVVTGKKFPLVFFHFHDCKCYVKGIVREFLFTKYDLPTSVKKYIYLPYIKVYKKAYKTIKQNNPFVDGMATEPNAIVTWWQYVKKLRRRHWCNHDNRYQYWIDLTTL